jgi:hypothetical protein
MTPFTLGDSITQTLITRLATINSAIAILDLTNDKPASVTIDDVLALAERVAPAARPQGHSPQPNGKNPRTGDASDKQIAALFGIGQKKGYSANDITVWVKRKGGKTVAETRSCIMTEP